MNIAMIGSGAAGSVFACYLKKGGAAMTLVDRYQKHMDACRESGLRFVTPDGEELLTGFQTASSASDIGVQDIVILMVKATQTESLIPDLLPCIGPETAVVSLQNGLGNDELLSRYFPADHILYGFGTIGTELPEPGKCVSKPESGVIMRFGAVKEGPVSSRAGQYLQDCFNAGGCSTVFESDIRPFVWKKAISNSGYNTLSALLRLKVGVFLASCDRCGPLARDAGRASPPERRFRKLLPLHGTGCSDSSAPDRGPAPERRDRSLRKSNGDPDTGERSTDADDLLYSGLL